VGVKSGLPAQWLELSEPPSPTFDAILPFTRSKDLLAERLACQYGAPCSGGATPVVGKRCTRGALVLDAV